jgi:peptidoglycan/LPS O-acetylase OafA/YrhL
LYAWLGQVSYAIYILHIPLLSILFFLSKNMSFVKNHMTLTAAVYGIVALAVATVLDIVYDMPIRTLLVKKLLSFRRQTSAAR